MKKTPFRMLILSAGMLFLLVWLINSSTSAKEATASTRGFYKNISKGRDFNYLIIGDSIGRGSGVGHKDETWFALFEEEIRRDYGSNGKRYSIVQSGATSFEGIVKYDNEKPRFPVDLVFIVFGENDRKYMDARQFSFLYEQLLRKVKTDHPNADIITFTESCLTYESFADTIRKVSGHYEAMNIDMRVPFKNSGLDTDKLTRDLIHPNKIGYELYAGEIAKSIKATVQSGKKAAPMPAPINRGLSREYKKIGEPSNQSGFVKSGKNFFSREKGSFIEYEFKGTMIGYTVERGPEGGEVDVVIDGKKVDTVSTWWPFKRERHIFLAGSLGEGPHRIRFVHTGEIAIQGSQVLKPSFRIKAIIAEKGTP
ncbi:SGNH/GDSL hydrolase family protein [Neobacillus piezotolerans]|nr:SGNH/GDSL hydrolase family protein [Neobacillus piezotolerans]